MYPGGIVSVTAGKKEDTEFLFIFLHKQTEASQALLTVYPTMRVPNELDGCQLYNGIRFNGQHGGLRYANLPRSSAFQSLNLSSSLHVSVLRLPSTLQIHACLIH